MDWTKQMCAVLIQEYEQRNELYEVSSKSYSNKHRRRNLLNEIREVLQQYQPKITVSDISRKINNMRSQYNAEKAKVKKSMVLGAGTGDVYSPKVWWFKHLEFLSAREAASNFSKELLPLQQDQEYFFSPEEDLAMTPVSPLLKEEELLPQVLTEPSTRANIPEDKSVGTEHPAHPAGNGMKRKTMESDNDVTSEEAAEVLGFCQSKLFPQDLAHQPDVSDIFGQFVGRQLREIEVFAEAERKKPAEVKAHMMRVKMRLMNVLMDGMTTINDLSEV